MSSLAGRESLFAKLKHAVEHSREVPKLPKNEVASSGNEAVSNALRRFVVDCSLNGTRRGSSQTPEKKASRQQRASRDMASVDEEQLEGHGFGLHELAVLGRPLS